MEGLIEADPLMPGICIKVSQKKSDEEDLFFLNRHLIASKVNIQLFIDFYLIKSRSVSINVIILT